MKTILKLRMGRATRLVEVVTRRADGGGTGWRVLMNGDRWFRETKTTVTEELIVFHAKDVVGEMKMNLHYGELEMAR